jgi:hypothetical protein
MTWLTVAEYLCHKWPRKCSIVVITIRSFPHSWFINGFVTRVTWRVPLVEEELLALPEHLISLSVFSGVRVAQSLVLCVLFCRLLFILLSFFLLSIALSAFLWFTTSDYLFGILDLWLLITPLHQMESYSNILMTKYLLLVTSAADILFPCLILFFCLHPFLHHYVTLNFWKQMFFFVISLWLCDYHSFCSLTRIF